MTLYEWDEWMNVCMILFYASHIVMDIFLYVGNMYGARASIKRLPDAKRCHRSEFVWAFAIAPNAPKVLHRFSRSIGWHWRRCATVT